MAFGAHVLALLEDALSECTQYHSALDTFMVRAGVPAEHLEAARRRADTRSKASTRKFNRAPKRFVAQEVLRDFGRGGDERDRVVASLITALCKTKFPDASPKASAAIKELETLRLVEGKEAETRRAEHRQSLRGEEREREEIALAKVADRERFRNAFLDLSQQGNPQARGYALEKFLNEFLHFEGLNPRGSFKITGEQIDGSFSWANRTYLVEAKWVSERVAANGFSSLMYKIDGKTADTRGLFLSINGYSPEAIEGLKRKGELRFVCLDGAHLIRCVEPGGSFPRLLETLWRHASETGEAYLPVSKL